MNRRGERGTDLPKAGKNRDRERLTKVPGISGAISKEITGRERTEEEIRRSEEIFGKLVKYAPAAIYEMDLQGSKFLSVNDVMCDILRYSREELLALRPMDLLDPECRPLFGERIRKKLRGEKVDESIEYRARRKDGEWITADIHVGAITYTDGVPTRVVVVGHEITERKRIESTLRQSEERYRALVENSPDLMARFDRDLRLTFANPAMLRRTALTAEELLGRRAAEYGTAQESAAAWEQAALRALETGEPQRYEDTSHWQGQTRIYDAVSVPERAPDGGIASILIIARDITEQKRAEELAGRNAKTFMELVERSPFGTYIVDSRFRIAQMNASSQDGAFRNVRPLIGRDFGEAMRILWPEPVAADIIAAFRRTLETGEPYVSPRFTQPRGDVAAVESYEWELHRLTLPDGQYGVICYYFDSTRLRDVEEALRRSEEKYRLLVRSAPSAIYEIDFLKNRFVTVNEAMCRMFGYSEAELLDMNPMDILDPESRIQFMDRMRRAGAGEPLTDSVEYKGIRKDGVAAWGILHNEFKYSGGRVVGAYVVAHDITARKLAEEELRASERNLRGILDAVKESIWAFDRDGRVLQTNRLALDRVAMGAKDVLGKRMADILPPDLSRTRMARLRDVIESARPVEFEDARAGMNFLHNFWPILDESGRVKSVVSFSRDITEEKKAEEALRESEQRFRLAAEKLRGSEEKYRSIVESSQEGILMADPQGSITYANERFAQMLGYTVGELIGKSGLELAADAEKDGLSEKLHERRQGKKGRYEMRLRRKDGAEISLYVSGSPVLDANGKHIANLAMYLDITEQRKAEALSRALAEQDRIRLGAAVEQASDSVVMFDLDGTIRYVNAAFETIAMLSRSRAVGRSYFEFLADEPAATAIREAIAQGKPWHGALTRPCSGRPPVELQVTFSPAQDPSGKVIGGLVTETDVTQRNALQQQVRQAQKMEALGTLAGGITHDFNNILGTIVINTELALLDLEPSDPARRPLPLVLQAAARGKDLVKQIITFSRQRAWERQPLAIAPIAREGMDLLRSTLPKDISIEQTIDDGSGIVLADPSHIHQILVNLCQNAALAMRDGGGHLSVGLAPVEVDEALVGRIPDLRPGPYVRLTVADTGCGMSAETLDRIFEPFFTTREKGQGSGLGLAVVHGIVKSYAGAIAVQSRPGRGTVFNIYFPRLDEEAVAAAAEPALQPARGRERILIVEDEEGQRTSLARGLERLGYKVASAAEGLSALSAFRKDPGAFDLVLTDQIMPRMSGLELASELVKLRPDIPILLCTGFSEKVDGGTVGQKGIRDLAMKPFTLTEVSRLIRKALDKENGAA